MVDAVLFRTSGILTNALSPCHQSYLALLWQALGDVAQLHVLTDLSLSLAPDLAAAELRRLSDAHQQKLSEQLNGIPSFAYTVADIVAAFPSVAWPVPGELYPTTMLNNDTRLWLRASWDRLEARGMRLTRRLETGKVVSNLLSYYVHEPSLCVWLRRQQLAGGNDIPRRATSPSPSLSPLSLSHTHTCPLLGASFPASVPPISADAVRRRVWVVEEDVVFIGDVRRAFLPFANSSADLITVFQPSAYIDDQWWLHANPAFRAALPGRPLHKWEHVERYSVALLLKLEDMLQRGAAAYGELFASTVCSRMSWCAICHVLCQHREARPLSPTFISRRGRCTTADLRDVGIVPQDAKLFADTVPLSRKTVSRLMRRTPRDVGRWVHATKDSCVMAAVARGQLPGPEKKTHRVL